MAEPYGWADRSGILWRSEDSKVVVSSEYKFDDEFYRIVVNDEEKMENQLVLRSGEDEWLEVVNHAITFAEGYVKGEDY